MSIHALSVETELPPNEYAQDSIGQTLSRIRIKQGHSLEDVTQSTKIRTYFLTLLEADDFNALPGTVFTMGFIRSYCDYLNISSKPLVEQYIEQCSKKNIETPFKIFVPQSSEKIIKPRVIFISILIICTTSVLWLITKNKNVINIIDVTKEDNITYVYQKNKKEQPLKKEKEDSEITNELNNSLIKSSVIPEPENNNQLSAKNEEAPSELLGLTNETPISELASSAQAATASAQQDTMLAQGKKDFSIEAIEETWLKITDEAGVRLKVSFLKKGDFFSLTPYHGNLISVGNVENVEFVHGETRIKGSVYLETASGFAEGKKIIAPRTPDMVE